MGKIVSVDPVTRVEGHLKVETEIDGGRVISARISGQMYRGFEKFLEGRHPLDAARIAQRVCGVCHEVHGVASVLALEELYGVKTPPNGKILRDLILGLHIVTDHILHFYTLSLPDYVDFTQILNYQGRSTGLNKVKQWVSATKPEFILKRNQGRFITNTSTCVNMIAAYAEALEVRHKGGGGMAVLGAKVPFIHALLPGGITTEITADKLMCYLNALEEVNAFVENTYIPDARIVAQEFREYFSIGETHNNYFTAKTFEQLGKPLFDLSVMTGGAKTPFDRKKVSEFTGHSWYNANGLADENKKDAYSWIKSPRYEGKPVEVGPLARMYMTGDADFVSVMKSFGQSGHRSSTMARILARAYESRRILKHLYSLLEKYRLGEPSITHVDLEKKVSGKGSGVSIAARGALIHEIEAQNGVITRYNMIVPSTWNFGPSDDKYPGTVEKALMGTPVAGSANNSIEVGRVIRSFDPCTACAVH